MAPCVSFPWRCNRDEHVERCLSAEQRTELFFLEFTDSPAPFPLLLVFPQVNKSEKIITVKYYFPMSANSRVKEVLISTAWKYSEVHMDK